MRMSLEGYSQQPPSPGGKKSLWECLFNHLQSLQSFCFEKSQEPWEDLCCQAAEGDDGQTGLEQSPTEVLQHRTGVYLQHSTPNTVQSPLLCRHSSLTKTPVPQGWGALACTQWQHPPSPIPGHPSPKGRNPCSLLPLPLLFAQSSGPARAPALPSLALWTGRRWSEACFPSSQETLRNRAKGWLCQLPTSAPQFSQRQRDVGQEPSLPGP